MTIPGDVLASHQKFHIGAKKAYSLYPRSVRDRVSKEWQEKHWNPVQKQALASATRKLPDPVKTAEDKDKVTGNIKKKI